MITARPFVFALLCASLSVGACNAPAPAGALRVDGAWARATPPGVANGAGYMSLTNGGSADRLVGTASPAADKVELHESAMEGQVMTMRPLGPVALKAGETVAFAPGGKHLMFMGLRAPLVAGTKVPVTLTFEAAGERQVEFEVRDAAPEGHGH